MREQYALERGSHGTASGEFAYPDGVAADSHGNIFVADLDNHRIQKFDNEPTES
jgi:hypothetical protein